MVAPRSDVPARRMRAQWLADRPHATVEAVAAHTIGVQAQDTAAARLAIRARSAATTAGDVRSAGTRGSVVRTWLMRNTLHLVAAADVRWLLAIFGPRNLAGGARRRSQLGLDDATLARALVAIEAVLAGGPPRSRADLVERLARRGVAIDPRGQAPAHLVAYAAAAGLICRGPDLDRDEPGYVLLDEWVPAAPDPDPEAALAELAGRYLRAYGPATPADLAAWSGLPVGTARKAVALAATADTPPAGPQSGPVPARAAPAAAGVEPVVRLLGAFDNYLMGYRDRAGLGDERIRPGGGIIHPAVIRDGCVVGRWRLRRDRDTIEVDPFEPLDPAPLAAEVADVARYLGATLTLTLHDHGEWKVIYVVPRR